MVIKNSSFENDIKIEKYGKHVSVNMGTQYAVVSCTKHHLSDFVKVVDELSMKGWGYHLRSYIRGWEGLPSYV